MGIDAVQVAELLVNTRNQPQCEPIKDWTVESFALLGHQQCQAEAVLQVLLHQVLRQPENVLAHFKRIAFCHRQHWSEQLQAALVDCLIILNGKGQALAQRLLSGCRSQLEVELYQQLSQHQHQPQQLPTNIYCLFSRGLLGETELLLVNQNQQPITDFIQLAQDYIEYSQLDEAMAVLEQGLLQQPQREDIQQSLLELYRSTRNSQRFIQTYQHLQSADIALVDGWRELVAFFDIGL